MKKIYILLFICFVNNAFTQNNSYRVFYNGKLIEEWNYEDGNIRSIVAYNLSDTKDSIIYNNGMKCFHYSKNRYVPVDTFSFQKYYYSNFDKSLSQNHIYYIIKYHTLLEDVLWSLALIDNEVAVDSARFSQNRIITEEEFSCSIEYKNLDVQCQLYGLFQTYNSEMLKSVKVFVKDGRLNKMMFVGENTNKIVVFEYTNDCLCKEKVYFYNNENEDISCYEEYCFECIVRGEKTQ